ncbi:amidase-like protein [Penicillium malachiteum]|uniref:amidase-like protein n=1 Tax=Penicillium malachiteum TaxID=1324776 RepID=UPI002548D978|nr:amidase-like protein [Penicillium malachiteum]KAJ5725647.1 amidase-like protein [Penicillium malachiteum]
MGQFCSLQEPFYTKLSRGPRLINQPETRITRFDLSQDSVAQKSSVLLETAIGSNENQQFRVSTVIETHSAAFIDPLKLSDTAVLAPLAVFLVRDNPLTTKYVRELIHKYLREDDVLCSDFLRTIIFVTEQDTVDEKDITSATVQKLIDHGAIIVGKTKTAEFAGSQGVIGDWADFSYAFNPRADGYLRCTGSSMGSSSGIASYPWLDLGAVYEILPSTMGFLGFDHPRWICGAKYATTLRTYRPKCVLYLEEYGSDRKDVQEIIEHVISQLSKWLGTEAVRVSLESLWKETNPIGTSESFDDYFKTTFMEVLASDYWSHESQFLQEYQRKFKSALDLGASITSAQKQAAIEKVRLHNSWFTKHVISAYETVIVIPRYNLQYRDDYLGPPENREFFGFDSNLHATFAGLPELVVPSIWNC